jgi:acetyl-CoA carboxylase carboxyl transferase subunit alpha
MFNNILDFEKPLIELENKIKELQFFMEEKEIDLSIEIEKLKERARNLQEEIYARLEPWQILKIARHPERPTSFDFIEHIVDDFIEFHGDRRFGDDKALIGGIGLIDGTPITILGHQKGKSTKENINRNFGMAHPEGYRKALRLMKQAEKFNRPIISLVNTPGAYPGVGAEQRGQAEAIAVNLMEMSYLKVPIIVIITGEGGSGGALGIGIGDRVMMLEYSYYSVSSPEACAAILWESTEKAPDAARALNITSSDLLKLGLIDKVIKEPIGGAHKNTREQARLIKKAIIESINDLSSISAEKLVFMRYEKFRKMGMYSTGEQLIELNDVQSN